MTTPIDLTNNYFDVWNILLYEVVGNEWLMLFLGACIILFFCVKYIVPMQVMMIIFILYLFVASALLFNNAVYVLAITLAGTIIYFLIAKSISNMR